MVLTVLAAMAQAERELASERVRDKVASSKKLGYWMGGHPPLGYDIINRELVINKQEAEIIRFIFASYLRTQSVTEVLRLVNERGYLTKTWVARTGKAYAGGPFSKIMIVRILENPLYCGKIGFKGEIYVGRHKPIVSDDDFQRANLPTQNKGGRQPGSAAAEAFILKGIIRCGDCGCPMSCTYSSKKNRHYRYYQCSRHLRGLADNCSVKRMPAGEIERLVEQEILSILRSEAFLFACKCEQDKVSADDMRLEFSRFDLVWAELFLGEKNKIITRLVHSVQVFRDKINISFYTQALGALLVEITAKPYFAKFDAAAGQLTCRMVPVHIERKKTGKAVLICRPGDEALSEGDLSRQALFNAMVLAYGWAIKIQRGTYASLEDVANREHRRASYVSRLFRMNFLAPDIVEAIVNGTASRSLTLEDIKRDMIPLSWAEQRVKYGFVA